MAVELLPKNSRMGFLRQAWKNEAATAVHGIGSGTNQWANALGTTTNFMTLNIDPGWKVNSNTNVSEIIETSSSSIYRDSDREYISSAGVLPTVDFSGLAVKGTLAGFLAAACQDVTSEAATTPYQKVYSMKSTVIDYQAATASEGYLFTVAGSMYDSGAVGDGWILQNAILNNFTLSFDNTAVGLDRLGKISGQWMGNYLLMNQTLTGTWAAQLNTGYIHDDGISDYFKCDITIGGTTVTDVCWQKYSITWDNGVYSNCFGQYGNAANLLRRNPKITVKVTIPWNASTYPFASKFQAGGAVDIDFYNQYTTGVNGYLDINSDQAILINDPGNLSGDTATFDIEAEIELKSAGTSGLTLTFADAIDWKFCGDA